MSLTLDSEKFQLDSGIEVFESLKDVSKSDKMSLTFHYNFSTSPFLFKNSLINFSSNGSNQLSETNKMTSKMINNFNVNSLNIITQSGFKNNLNAYFKNINILGKKNPDYKNSLQTKLTSIFEETLQAYH